MESKGQEKKAKDAVGGGQGIPFYHVDAFTSEPIGGNLVVICIVDPDGDDRGCRRGLVRWTPYF